MTDQLSFDALARNTDPVTSHIAAALPFKRESQRHKLLLAYGEHPEGLIDEQAGWLAGVRGGAWKRCSELRNAGLIEATTETRMSSFDAPQQVCFITFAGKRALGLLS